MTKPLRFDDEAAEELDKAAAWYEARDATSERSGPVLMLAAEADPDWPGVGTRVRLRERCCGKLSLPGGWDCVVMTGMA